MQRTEKTVFISYRRTNTPWALAIYQNLTMHGFDVFFDYDSIKSGDFAQIISQNIKGRAHFLIVLTPSALERCSEPGDWLRREIEWAVDSQRNIVPLFLEGFDFGTPSIEKHLTGKLAMLKRYNGLSVPAEYFDAAMGKLRDERLTVRLDTILHPISTTVQQKVRQQQIAASKAPGIKENTLTAQEWFERGLNTSNIEDKIYYNTKAIQLQPKYADAYYNRGWARSENGDHSGAIADYTEAIRIKPNYAAAFNNRGISRRSQGDIAGAINDYTEAIRLKPNYESAFNNRGIARRHQGDTEGAIADYDEAIRLKPDYASAFNNRGIIYKKQGNLKAAIADYTAAIRFRPNYQAAFNNRGNALKEQGDVDGAIADYTEAIRLQSNDPDAYYNRGIARKRQGDLVGAIMDYSEAIRLRPDDPDSYYNRAIVHKEREDFMKAITDYQKYLDLGGGIRDGDQEEVEEIIRKLKKRL